MSDYEPGEGSDCASCPEPIVWTGYRWVHRNPHNVRNALAHAARPVDRLDGLRAAGRRLDQALDAERSRATGDKL